MIPHHVFLDFEGRRLSGVRPFAVWETRGGDWSWKVESSTRWPFTDGRGNVLDELQRALKFCKAQHPDGGAIGFFSYELAQQIEPRTFITSKPDDLEIPDARLVFYAEIRDEAQPPAATGHLGDTSRNVERSRDAKLEHEQAVAHILEFIAAGDIYQANYTQRLTQSLPCSPSQLYNRLRARNPAPFAAFLEWDDFTIVSNSPEKFLSLNNRVLESQPIKGTIARGTTPQEDDIQKLQLQQSVKDRAENVMIVDLLRNDLGRVCEFGSIHVPNLFEVQTFPTLHHLVSTVRGTLREDCDAVDAIRAAFPCGSITGAPKIRAMQILDELEPQRRGVSMGAIGALHFNGNMNLNVAIRTVTCINGNVYFHVGGGIVADSVASDEYAEMRLKARAIESALHK